MTQRHIKALELSKILQLCSGHAITQQAKADLLELEPAASFAEAKRLSEETTTANDLSVRFSYPPITPMIPCKESLGRADLGGALSFQELLDLASILRSARTVALWYRQAAETPTILDSFFEALTPGEGLEKEITRCILSEDEMADNASPALSDIRRSIRNSNQKAREVLDKMTRSTTYQKFLQEQIVTIRNGRFVVPVRAEYRGEVKGLVHDTSASGSTLFVEPMAVVELNNSIRELESAQQSEIHRILLSLSAQVAAQKAEIQSNYTTLVALDLLFAKSKLGDRMKAMPPQLVETGETILRDARHPLIPRDQVVPIDISIGGEFDTLVITGPNTGGKTVALKTLGLLTLMASCGFMIPAAGRSKVRFYNQVLADIGDEQSIEQSLSTFSGHMTNIVSILKVADSQSLVLIDELGAGTDPVEGAALAVAIISQLRTQRASILATTHYAEMKIFALQTPGVENASCEFDVATLRPTYRLLIGTPGRSNAFAISQRLGISQGIVDHAQQLISTENRRFEDVVSGLEETRQQLETERKQAQNLRLQAAEAKKTVDSVTKSLEEQQEKVLEDAQGRARSLLERVRFQADQIMEELEQLKKQKDKASFSSDFSTSQSRLKGLIGAMEDLANPVVQRKEDDYQLPRKLQVGDVVFLTDFGTEGTVLSPPDSGGNVRVQAGILESKVLLTSIRLLEKSQRRVTLNGGAVRTRRVKATGTPSSETAKLDLRGMDSQEAAMELDRFIDRSVLDGLRMLTIVHGKGTGVLREMVGQKLHQHPQVASHRLGGYGEGGDGVSIAELK